MNGVLRRHWPRYAPPWFTGDNIRKFYNAVGALLDGEAQRTLDGRLAAIPYAGAEPGAAKLANGQRIECQEDALDHHARDRELPTYASAPTWGRRVQIASWHQLHQQRGTHQGEMRMLRHLFQTSQSAPVPMIRIVHASPDVDAVTFHTLSESGIYSVARRGHAQWDVGAGTGWSEFDVIVYSKTAAGVQIPLLTAPDLWDGGELWDGGALWDGMTAQAISDVVHAGGLDWKAAHSRLRWFIVCDDFTALNPDTTPATDAAGWTNLPSAGNWKVPVYTSGADIGKNTRPPYLRFLYDKDLPTS